MAVYQSKSTPAWLISALVTYGYRFPDHPGKWRIYSRLIETLKPRVERRVVTRHGQQWNLTPDDYAQSMLFWTGVRDQWEIHHLNRLLPPDPVIIDAGANFGYHAATVSRLRQGRCRVIAVEPHPDNFARLRETVALNRLGNIVECHQLALSNRIGRGGMVIPDENSGHAHVVEADPQVEVPVTSLDEFVKVRGLDKLHAVLLDVEGLEDRALEGASATIDHFAPLLLVEIWQPVLHQQGTDSASVVAILDRLGYRLYHAQREQLVPATDIPRGDKRLYAICVHKSRPDPVAVV